MDTLKLQQEIAMGKINLYSDPCPVQLARSLALELKESYRGLVFQPVYLVTPNKAQHNWLKEQLAKELGFIANLEQHSLKSLIQNLFQELFPEKKEQSRLGHLVWNLFSALGKKNFQKQFPKIAKYCGKDEIKRLALAQKVAVLFQDYEQYRPDLIKNWLEMKVDVDLEEEAWQAYLYVSAGYSEKFVHPEEFRKELAENSEILNFYKSLYIFGEVDFTPLQIQYLKILGEQTNFKVHIYRSNLEFKAEKNPLAQNWGQLALIANAQLQNLAVIPRKKMQYDLPKNDLNRVQQGILLDKEAEDLVGDDSMLIYNSFTKVREVEALYNYLVKTVDEANKKGKKIGARDIAVYIPDLDSYIPAIKTVFDSAPYTFPYTIVSRGFSREENFWTALEQILSFEEEDFTAPKVFNLIEMQPIQKSFGFTDLDLLRKAFIDANIRRDYRGNEELETHTVSFKNGLERLIYGFCFGDESPVEIDGKKIWPVDIAEGSAAQDLFRLHHLVELLHDLTEKKKKKKKAGEWHAEMLKIADTFLHPEEWEEKRFESLMENLVNLDTTDEEIEFRTFFLRLKDHLQNQDLQQIKGQGGIVFSGLYSGVSIPKKVVAILGLNFKEFPRRSHQLSFDLLTQDDKPSSRAEDRGAFLQAFLNAQEKVLLSYIGQNVKDNSEIPSSSIISELQDYAEKNGGEIKEVKHLLHSFNSAYFDPVNVDLFTYRGSRESIALKKGKQNILIPEEVLLHQLEAFLKDPFKYHYNKVLGIYYEDLELLPEWECFELDKLQEWGVKDQIKEETTKSENLELEELRTKMILESKLPLKNIGRSKLAQTKDNVAALLKKVDELSNGRPMDVLEDDLSFILDGGHKIDLKIKLDVIGEDALFLIVSKKNKLKYELSAYIRALVLKAIGCTGILHYFCMDGDDPHHQEIRLEKSSEDAKKQLKKLLTLYVKNFERIIPFYPELDLKVDKLKECEDKPEVEKTELIRGLVDDRFDSWNSFFPSDYFLREVAQGFFEGVKGEANLIELQKLTIDITEEVDIAFNK